MRTPGAERAWAAVRVFAALSAIVVGAWLNRELRDGGVEDLPRVAGVVLGVAATQLGIARIGWLVITSRSGRG